MAAIRKDAFRGRPGRVRGRRPSLFLDSGRHKPSGRRCGRWHLGTVLPLARLLEYELTVKLENAGQTEIRLLRARHGKRATVVAKLAQAGVPMQTALDAVNLDGG